ncbi:hypothetical protein SCLARK_00655 [Spiroplasma clarkii]|uniref:Lipoprotein n=1 Tax=Spiroplasma clarkii TaxID=2139 RepID=A0A1Y0L0T0_9MOLU|nr:hypothetical protein [Spiroplasma clarkii]ARU91318.1 hypothetical protein SCLARK_00655 [Spiroplasma clarkii]ATX70742.1 hypothetical protein SCLAR_v1c04180 [Spiroplasma clarkii]
MKKLLKTLASVVFISTTAVLTVSCDKNWIDYIEIERPDPVYAIRKTGFQNFAADKIDVNKFVYTYDLIDEVKFYLTDGGYDLKQLNWEVVRNKMVLEKGLEDNLLRNGTYIFTITNSQNGNDKITIEQKITNSKYLPDVIVETDLKDIEDNRVRTILMRMIFRNLGLISRIDDIANEMVNSDKINPEADKVTLDFGSFDKENRDKFYGTTTLTYRVVDFTPDWGPGPIDINDLAAKGNTVVNNDLGTLRSITPYQAFSQYVTNNFANKLNYLSILVNDIDVDGYKIALDSENGLNAYTLTFNTIANHDDGYPSYLTGTIVLTFRYFGINPI